LPSRDRKLDEQEKLYGKKNRPPVHKNNNFLKSGQNFNARNTSSIKTPSAVGSDRNKSKKHNTDKKLKDLSNSVTGFYK